jgi:hypothetical protein
VVHQSIELCRYSLSSNIYLQEAVLQNKSAFHQTCSKIHHHRYRCHKELRIKARLAANAINAI